MCTQTPERRRIAALCGATAAISGSSISLALNHPWLHAVILAVVVCVLVYAISRLARLRHTPPPCS